MAINELKNKLVAVLGFGLEGRATINYLIKHGVKPVLFDAKPWENWDEIEKLEIKKLGINFIFGPQAFKELRGFDVAFRSPGIALSHPDLQQITKDKKSKLIITSQTIWFFSHCPCKIIGVTGTKGKGTTASLIHQILINSSKTKSYLTGNIGKIQPFQFLDKLTPEDWVVYELSSFQLQDLKQSPHIGVVLMTTSEHLDYHKDEAEYVAAKSAIVKYQSRDDFAVINADFPNSKKIGALGEGKRLFFSRKIYEADCYARGGVLNFPAQNFQFDLNKLALPGPHNYENACAAVLAGFAAGCGAVAIKKVLRSFKGLEHRLEFVAKKKGVKFYNDSFATTPETAIAAIESFQDPEIIILGGSSKKSNFSKLITKVSQTKNLKAVILIGDEAENLHTQLVGKYKGKILTGAKNLTDVFGQIKILAKAGDVVLFSPACASFDWFKNYKDRGLKFKKLAKQF